MSVACPSFNGAMLFRAWNELFPRELITPNPCFNGAMLFRAWNAIWRFNAKSRRYCFNGAMLFRAWNARASCPTVTEHNASMGPCSFEHGMAAGSFRKYDWATLQWGHALSSMECRRSDSRRFGFGGFNGAMLFRAWNVVRRCSLWRRLLSFNGAMLFRAWNDDCHGQTKALGRASMGPCSFEHGMVLSNKNVVDVKTLQWGHALSSMEWQ